MTPSPVSSTPILKTAVVVSAIGAAVLAAAAATIGYFVDGTNGMWSGLLGVLLAVFFLAITALSILIANRWFGQALYVQLFFAVVLGGWLFKLGAFVVIMIVLGQQPWISPLVLFLAIVTGVIFSLAVDVIVMTKMRLPNVSDTTLPTEVPEDRAPGQAAATSNEAPRDGAAS